MIETQRRVETAEKARHRAFTGELNTAVVVKGLKPGDKSSVWNFIKNRTSPPSRELAATLLFGLSYNQGPQGQFEALDDWRQNGMPGITIGIVVAVEEGEGLKRAQGRIIGITGRDETTGEFTGVATIQGHVVDIKFNHIPHLVDLPRRTSTNAEAP